VGSIVLDRGEDDSRVRQWLKTAAGVPGFIGFAVCRTSFWVPLINWKHGRIAREAAVSEIAPRYWQWVKIFEAASAATELTSTQGAKL
jgi:5-dehydro-2-deoxygluconokinase